MDRILFGDNQFFGVNHMSEEKARQQLVRFKETSSIIRVLDDAYDMGIRTFMCTTHDRIGEICDHMRANPARYRHCHRGANHDSHSLRGRRRGERRSGSQETCIQEIGRTPFGVKGPDPHALAGMGAPLRQSPAGFRPFIPPG